MASLATGDRLFDIPLEGENREEEEDNRTQLQKDIESKAGVIPIWPWVDPITGDTKNGVPPQVYAGSLTEAKIQDSQPGAIIRCSDPKCESRGGIGTKSMYWRSNMTSSKIVPKGWTNTGGRGPYIMCPNCRAQDIHDFGLGQDAEYYREGVDASTGHSGATSSGNNKSLPPHTYSRPRNTLKRERALPISSSKELLKKAEELFKGKIAPDRLKRLENEIKKEERDKRAKAAESRKRRKTSGGKRRRKKRTRRGGKSRKKRRKKNTKKKGGRKRGRTRRKKRGKKRG